MNSSQLGGFGFCFLQILPLVSGWVSPAAILRGRLLLALVVPAASALCTTTALPNLAIATRAQRTVAQSCSVRLATPDGPVVREMPGRLYQVRLVDQLWPGLVGLAGVLLAAVPLLCAFA